MQKFLESVWYVYGYTYIMFTYNIFPPDVESAAGRRIYQILLSLYYFKLQGEFNTQNPRKDTLAPKLSSQMINIVITYHTMM